ncbi:MAG: HD domain-containing protein [Yoonia sp.]
MLKTVSDAENLIQSLGASRRLEKHLELVGEVGRGLTSKLDELGVQYNKTFVQIGIAIHDAGKIIHPEELEMGGHLHESAGEILLLEQGVDADIARCCRSHSQYDNMSVSFEELIIALADTLWKGTRAADLELRVIDAVAARLCTDRWAVFELLDRCFEEMASEGDERLSRSI